jgi:hypothetical protein
MKLTGVTDSTYRRKHYQSGSGMTHSTPIPEDSRKSILRFLLKNGFDDIKAANLAEQADTPACSCFPEL